jgi:CubicO group peptidase (beta-lactamase class C family)
MKFKIEKLFTCVVSLVLLTSSSIGSLSMGVISTSVDDFSLPISSSSTQDTFWPLNSSEWTEVAPETQGLNSSKIAEMFEFIKIVSFFDIHSVIIVRNGYLLTEEYLRNFKIYRNIDGSKSYYNYSTLHEQMSATKSLTSILIGIALQEGLLDNLNQTLYEFYADIWDPSFVDSELKKNITIGQLLTMNSGLMGENDPSYPSGAKTATAINCINWALDKVPLSYTPGEEGEFAYSNDGPNLLSGIIANVTGYSTEEFAKEYLFEPLGISEEEYYWMHDEQNVTYGAYLFQCTPKVQAKLGILSLNNGTWNGKQIADLNFMKNATTAQILLYGYLWWITEYLFEGYLAEGLGGQSIYVIPEYNIIVGFTASNGIDTFYEQLISDYIIYQITDPPENGPNIPGIPGIDFNLIFLMIFCTSALLIIKKKKKSKN